MVTRAYGWVQNPSNFAYLKNVVQIFVPGTPHYELLCNKLVPKYIFNLQVKRELQEKLKNNEEEFTYAELVGGSKDKNGRSPNHRSEAVADGLIQVTIPSQRAKTTGKYWTDNWTADGYLRWALSLNFVQHDRDSDVCSITDLGRAFALSPINPPEEDPVLCDALLSYPPAMRVLQVLNDARKPMTKFAIGSQLGFSGEKGFTSYDESLMNDWLNHSDSEERGKIRQNVEGTSDKYARMIATWLVKLGFVSKERSTNSAEPVATAGFETYKITALGQHSYGQANGNSRHVRRKKYLTWEFLATSVRNRDYIRSRRACILNYLRNGKSFRQLLRVLNDKGFKDDPQIIVNDLNGLQGIGLCIDQSDIDVNECTGKVELRDNLNELSIPIAAMPEHTGQHEEELERKKAEMLRKTDLPNKYVELIELAYDGGKTGKSADFEIITVELFRNVYGFQGRHLGGGSRPDGVIYTDKFGVILDTKAYASGYGKNINQEDEMERYIRENQKRDAAVNSTAWWNAFGNSVTSENTYFMWVSSYFKNHFDEQLQNTSRNTGAQGAALKVEQLLLGADLLQKGEFQIDDFPKYMRNEEIVFVDTHTEQ